MQVHHLDIIDNIFFKFNIHINFVDHKYLSIEDLISDLMFEVFNAVVVFDRIKRVDDEYLNCSYQ
jgi:hypothetical protein